MIEIASRTRANLGSGLSYDPNAVNVDITASTKPDVVHDLNVRPWPFPDNRFNVVEMCQVLEHLDDTVAVMEELHRIARPGGAVHIAVPHFSSDDSFRDPTHRRHFSALSFDYFAEGHPRNFYSQARFAIKRRQIIFRPTLLNKVVWRLANRFPEVYENRWAWVLPAWMISVELLVVKPNACG